MAMTMTMQETRDGKRRSEPRRSAREASGGSKEEKTFGLLDDLDLDLLLDTVDDLGFDLLDLFNGNLHHGVCVDIVIRP